MGPAAGYAAVAAHDEDLGSEHGDPARGRDHDDTASIAADNTANPSDAVQLGLSPAGSTPSTTTNTSPLTTDFLARAGHSSTPLSLLEDALHADDCAASTSPGRRGPGASAAAVTAADCDSGKPAAGVDAAPAATMSTAAASPTSARRASSTTQAPPAAAWATARQPSALDKSKLHMANTGDAGHLISPTALRYDHATAAPAKDHQLQHELLTGAGRRDPVQAQPRGARDTVATPPGSSSSSVYSNAYSNNDDPQLHDALSPLTEFPRLRTGSVQPGTRVARPKPILRTTSDAQRLALRHPVPDLNVRTGAYAGNIAQLEATAERLSMTSSIDDAIRGLHGELKRSDSRRSSILAASVKATSPVTDEIPGGAAPSAGQLQRHLSNASSIISTNIAARHGGYSPAAYVMSPNHSFSGRLRSGSKGSASRPDADIESGLSRHGPGKASVRSVRSTKMSLAEISESEPISLNQTAFDEADKAASIDNDDNDEALKALQQSQANMASTDMFHETLGGGFAEPSDLDLGPSESRHHVERQDFGPTNSPPENAFQQTLDPFIDFDGVHWEPTHEDDDSYPPPDHESDMLVPRPGAALKPRPQSYLDPESGQHMLFYPARVPAMLNLPRKLGNRPKAAQRTQRRSQVLDAMAEVNRQSAMPEAEATHNARDSWLPDPLAGHHDSFVALSAYDQLEGGDQRSVRNQEPASHEESQPEAAPEHLRRPQRLSRMDFDNRKSRVSQADNLPSQLRASVFFDRPSESPSVQVKDGSAMATLESILDASAHAPVSAFTDNAYGDPLGSEVYGKEKKRKSKAPAATLRPVSASQEPKKRSSFMWLGKRASYNSIEGKHGHKSKKSASSALGSVEIDHENDERQALTSSIDGESVLRRDRGEPESEHEEGEPGDEDEYHGPPTTLLAELQIRKQEQKQRTQPLTQQFPNGVHATLLEMDAVAEAQRKNRQTKRVNLAWEDPDAHLDQNGSDDEDVPLAIIAAKHQGAKNMADLDQPIGLLELREMEENEPLSLRRARLQGLEPTPLTHHKRRSMMTLTAPSRMGDRSPASQPISREVTPEPEEIEGETLGERKRRLAAKEEAGLPPARPVSSSFSAELLSQFGDLDGPKERPSSRMETSTPPKGDGEEEETLGQRRQRLQKEREAREREMSYGNLAGRATPNLDRRMSMADILSSHPKSEHGQRAQEERMRKEEQNRVAREQQAKLAAVRRQMPTALTGPSVDRSGGFRGGVYNDGAGGLMAAQSSPAVNSQGFAPTPRHRANRSSTALNGIAQMQQPGAHGAMSTYGGMGGMGPYGGMGMNQYGDNTAMSVYGGGMMQPGMQMQMQMPMSTGSMDRVERWRQSVQP